LGFDPIFNIELNNNCLKPASLNDLKKELQLRNPQQWLELCLRMAKYKKENKELLSFLLFLSEDEAAYIVDMKKEMDMQFKDLNTSTYYKANKSLRKVLKYTNKQIRYSGSKRVECELLIYFCSKYKALKLKINSSTMLANLWNGQLVKIQKAISNLHEDLQFDYQKELVNLGSEISK